MRDQKLHRILGPPPTLLAALSAADGASRAGLLGAMQRTVGNAATQRVVEQTGERSDAAVRRPQEIQATEPIVVAGWFSHAVGAGGSFSVHGQTDATFDGGTGKMVNQKATKSQGCEDCADGQCMHVTGALVVTYHVDVVVTMPDVPDGLSACEEAKVRQFINTTLRDHENEHVRRFKTYNGTKAIPINVTGCGEGDVQSQVQTLHDADEQIRQAKAQKLSDDIDPFTRSVDLSKCQE